MMLYVVSPLFASSMSLDEGSRFQNWTQSFVMQLVAAYGGVVMMRLYLLVVPIVLNDNLVFFKGIADLNLFAQLAVVLAGAWAVSRGSSVIAGALSGNAAGAVLDADSTFGRTISDFMGASRLYNEIGRRRMNRDRRKSHEEANKATNNSKDSKNSDTESRKRDKAPKDDGQSTSAESTLNRLREKYDMNGGLEEQSKAREFETAELSSVAKMRSQMGLDNLAGENDKFDVDSLPDIAAQTSGRTRGSARTGGGAKTTGGTKTGDSTRTSNTNTVTGGGTRTSNTNTATGGGTGTSNTNTVTGGGTRTSNLHNSGKSGDFKNFFYSRFYICQNQ